LSERHHPTVGNVIGFFAEKVRRDAHLIGNNAVLHGKIKRFVANHLFGNVVDLDDPNVVANLNEIEARKTILETTKKAVNAATIRDRGATEEVGMMSFARTIRPHVVSMQDQIRPDRSILNRIVGDSHLELEFAGFLDGCGDIVSFLKNSPSTHFHIEYQTADGGIADYYPDFVVKRSDREVWIVETKGREDLDDPRKWQRLRSWCEDATLAHPSMIYRPLFVPEEKWKSLRPRNFRELIAGFAE